MESPILAPATARTRWRAGRFNATSRATSSGGAATVKHGGEQRPFEHDIRKAGRQLQQQHGSNPERDWRPTLRRRRICTDQRDQHGSDDHRESFGASNGSRPAPGTESSSPPPVRPRPRQSVKPWSKSIVGSQAPWHRGKSGTGKHCVVAADPAAERDLHDDSEQGKRAADCADSEFRSRDRPDRPRAPPARPAMRAARCRRAGARSR